LVADDTQQRETDERAFDDEVEDPDDLEENDDLDVDEDEPIVAVEDDEDEAEVAAVDEDELEQASLEQLRDQRSARKRLEVDDDEDLLSLVSESEEPEVAEPVPPRVTPIKDRQEFVCARCHLVKPRVQLADAARGLCRDCA
jgi:hypothetical protein